MAKYRGFFIDDKTIVPNSSAHDKYAKDISTVVGIPGYAPFLEDTKRKYLVIRGSRKDPNAHNVVYSAIKDVKSGIELWVFHITRGTRKGGDYISSGMRFFVTGNTGISKAPHTEIQVRKNGKRLNPSDYLSIKNGTPRKWLRGKPSVTTSEMPQETLEGLKATITTLTNENRGLVAKLSELERSLNTANEKLTKIDKIIHG